MKPDIHPLYRQVFFHDTTADVWFKVGSTIATTRTWTTKDKSTPMSPWRFPARHTRITPAKSAR